MSSILLIKYVDMVTILYIIEYWKHKIPMIWTGWRYRDTKYSEKYT